MKKKQSEKQKSAKNKQNSVKTSYLQVFKKKTQLHKKKPKFAGKPQGWQHRLPTTWQEFELMFRNSGLLHHQNYCRRTNLSAMLTNNFGTSTCFAIFELVKFMCFNSTFSYRAKSFSSRARSANAGTCNPRGLTHPAQNSILLQSG